MAGAGSGLWRDLGVLARAAGKGERRGFLLLLALMLAGAVAELVTVGAAIPLIALAADPQTSLAPGWVRALPLGPSPVWAAAALLALAAVAATAIRLVLAWAGQRFVMRLGHGLSVAIFSRTLRQPYREFLRGSSTDVLAGLEKTQILVYGLLQPAMQGLVAVVLGAVIAAFLFAIEPVATGLGALVLVAVYLLIGRLTRARVERHAAAYSQATDARIKLVQEGMGGIRDILLERSQGLYEASFARADLRHRQAHVVLSFVNASPRLLVEGAAILAIAAVTALASGRPGGLTAALPVLGALALGAQRLLPLVQQAWAGWNAASGRRHVLADVAGMLRSAPNAAPAAAETPLPLRESIELNDLRFAYEPGAPVLDGLSLTIRRGEHLGLAGPSGGGKSTLLDILMGLLEPQAGALLVDGARLDDRERARWQAAIAHVPQAVFLADDTIAANIAFAVPGPVDRARLRDALHRACLDELVATLPDGPETQVGERGIRLSGGQRQRIGLARALYKGAAVLILDEATSALDAETEAEVLRRIANAPGERTVIVVAHRASSLALCDRVVEIASVAVARLVTSTPDQASCGTAQNVLRD